MAWGLGCDGAIGFRWVQGLYLPARLPRLARGLAKRCTENRGFRTTPQNRGQTSGALDIKAPKLQWHKGSRTPGIRLLKQKTKGILP